MSATRTAASGLIGGVAALLILGGTGAVTHADGDLAALTATTLLRSADGAAWIVGLLVQLVIGVVAAFAYATVFALVTRRAGVVIGLLTAIPHVVIAGLVVGFVPADRIVAGGILPPGAFYEYRGLACTIAFVAAYLVFGAIVGGLHARTVHVAAPPNVRWIDVPRP
jgi:hypothetical protein